MSDEITLLRRQLQQSQAENFALKQQQQQFLGTQSNVPITSQPANVFHQSHRVNALARSQSTVGYSSFVGDYGTQGPKAVARLNRAYSQQSPTSMSRAVPSRLESSMPFRPTGPISSLDSQPLYRSASDQARMNHRTSSHQSLANIQENDVLPGVGVNPADFIANYSAEDTYLATTRPLAPNDIPFFQNPSACPSMYSGVSALDATSPMTRQNSTFENAPNWGVDMVNTASSQSMFATGSTGQEHMLFSHMGFSQTPGSSQKQHPAANQDLLGLGANLQDASPLSSYESTSFDNSLTLQSDLSISMERSGSNESTSSTSSTSSNRSTESNLERRAKERHRQVLENSKRGIVPKPHESDPSSPPATKRKSKVTPSKAPYQRRRQPRVYCNKCKEHPGGFRGDHELQRHVNAKHAVEVVKYVCRDPATLGMHSTVTPKVPLQGCKSCDSGKPYGAYYNAAAHLRRAHFVPKLSRGKAKGNEERRGGKAGGSWPKMEDLKLWYEKITVTSASASVSPSDEAESPEEEEEEEEEEVEDMELEAAEPMAEAQQETPGLAGVVATMGSDTAEWPAIIQPEISIPESQEFMPFPGNISLENSPANLSYTEDNSPPMWGSATSNSFASSGLEFLNQDSPAMGFPSYV